MPPSTWASRHPKDSGVGSTPIITWSAVAITTALAIVPSPGRSRSGIHMRSTTTLVKKVARPMEMPVRTDTP